MKTVVIYKSRTGFTRQYAEWIAQALDCEAREYKQIEKLDLSGYDKIILGGRVHAGIIDGVKRAKKFIDNQKLIVFATGATPITASDIIEGVMKTNLGDSDIPRYYMPSGLRYDKMGFFDKLIMKVFSKMMAAKKDKSDDELGTMQAIGKSFDESDISYIQPLVDYVKHMDAANTHN